MACGAGHHGPNGTQRRRALRSRRSIIGVHDFLKLVRRGVATLRQILETRGTMEPDIARTLDMLIDPAATADELQDRTRECLGRAMFVSAELPKRRLQCTC